MFDKASASKRSNNLRSKDLTMSCVQLRAKGTGCSDNSTKLLRLMFLE